MSASYKPRSYWFKKCEAEIEDLKKRVALLEGKKPIVDLSLKDLVEIGDRMEKEQEKIDTLRTLPVKPLFKL